MKPRVSVIMPIWNAEPSALRAAIRSVLDQTLTNLELLVLEDASARPASSVLDGIEDARVRHMLHESKSSMAAARNRGLRAARADIIAICDGDDVCRSDRLEKQSIYLDQHADVAVVGSWIEIIDERGIRGGQRRYPSSHDAILRAMPRYNPLAHPSVAFRKSVVLDAGGYDESEECICEDYELWSRLATAGARFANIEEDLLSYRVHAGASKRTRLQATLRDTIRIKQRYWRRARSLRSRARILGERVLLALPPSFVYWLFRRTTLQSR